MAIETVKARLGPIHLTEDGLETGTACRIEAEGLNALRFNKIITVTEAANGSSNLQGVEVNKSGLKITLNIFALTKTVLDSIIELIDDALEAGDSIEAEFTKDFTETVNVLPAFENRTYYTEKRIKKGRAGELLLYDVRLTLQTVS
jgi:hypothetical protein